MKPALDLRPLPPEAWPELVRLHGIAFGGGYDAQAQREKPLPDERDVRGYLGVFDAQGRLASALQVLPFAVGYDGHIVGMLGIGGVATLPEQRAQGNVRALLTHVFEQADAYMQHCETQQPQALYSALYPFSNSYYRRFGYEAILLPSATVNMTAFEAFGQPDSVEMLAEPGDAHGASLDTLTALHDAFARTCNLNALRGGAENTWNDALNGGLKKARYAYLMRDADGTPNAYLVLHSHSDPGNQYRNRLTLRDFGCRDEASLRKALGFLYTLRARYTEVSMMLPADTAPYTWFAEPYDGTFAQQSCGMARLLDARRGLELMRHPRGSGGYTLQVTDAFCPKNDGVYRVEYQDGKALAVRENGGTPDAGVSIEALALLTLGCLSWREALGRGDVRPYANDVTLSEVFIKKRLYPADRY